MEHLQVHLNGDEGMSFGSSFIASNSSSSFKVKKVYLTQHPKNEIEIRISPLTGDSEPADVESDSHVETPTDAEEGKEGESEKISYHKSVILYKKKDYLGQKKTINVVYDKAMKIDAVALTYGEDGEVVGEEQIATIEIPELDEIV